MIYSKCHFSTIHLTTTKVILLAALFILSGCSTAPKIPPTPSSLASISINYEIDVLEGPQKKIGTETLDKVFTKLGADWPEERQRKFEEFFKQVDIQALVEEGVQKRVSMVTLPVSILESKGEATLKFSVTEYGIDQALEGLKMPLIEVKAELIKPDGRVIWDDSESINRRDQFKTGINTRTWYEYESNIALMKADFSSAIDIVVKEIFEKLKKDYISGDVEN